MPDEIMYTVTSPKEFPVAVAAVEARTVEKGFSVLAVHDVAATLQKKGFQLDPLKIVEVCNARHANTVLKSDIAISLMLPCRINIYEQEGKVYISTMRPTMLAGFFPAAGVAETAAEVDRVIREIIDGAK